MLFQLLNGVSRMFPVFYDGETDGAGGGGGSDDGSGGGGGSGSDDGAGGNEAWPEGGYEINIGEDKHTIAKPEDFAGFLPTLQEHINNLQTNSNLVETLKGLNLQSLAAPGGGGDKNTPKDKGGGKNEDKQMSKEELISTVLQTVQNVESVKQDTVAAEQFLKENELDVPIEQVQNWADDPDTKSKYGELSDLAAAKLMKLDDVRKAAEAAGRKKGRKDNQFSVKPVNPRGSPPQGFDVKNIHNATNEQLTERLKQHYKK